MKSRKKLDQLNCASVKMNCVYQAKSVLRSSININNGAIIV